MGTVRGVSLLFGEFGSLQSFVLVVGFRWKGSWSWFHVGGFLCFVGMKRIRDDVYPGSQFKRPFGSSRGES